MRLQRFAGAILIVGMTFGGCASSGDLEKLENRVSDLEGNIEDLTRIAGTLATRLNRPESVDASDITTPQFCQGQTAVWGGSGVLSGPGLSC